MRWLGPIPTIRHERHFDGRVVRCFAERPANVNAMLADAAQRRGRHEALVSGSERLDWRTLEERAARLAGGMAALGIGRGDRVAILAANGVNHVVTLLAASRIGAIWQPLNIRERKAELTYVLAHSGATLLFHDPAFAAELPDQAEVPALVHRVPLTESDAACMAMTTATPVAPVAIGEEEVAALLYTSGTTGRPKGAMLTHLGLVHAAMIYEACMALDASDRAIVAVPMSHVTALTAGVMTMLRVAGCLIIAPPFKADAFVHLAAAERMTQTVMVPAQYNLILMSPAMAEVDLSRWRIGAFGGAPMPAETIRQIGQRLPNLNLMNAYGATETTGPVVAMPPSETAARRTSVGRAVPVADILVVDDDGREVPAGETGEIWLRAPNTVAGYWDNPAATAEAFVAGYWRSGDVGRIDVDGYLTLLDRKKDMINRGGFKIYSVEVENVIAACPGVMEVAVVGRPCPVLSERVHAVVVAKDGVAPPDPAELRKRCAVALADYKVPESFMVVGTPLPRNAAGKVLKRDLRAMLEQGGT